MAALDKRKDVDCENLLRIQRDVQSEILMKLTYDVIADKGKKGEEKLREYFNSTVGNSLNNALKKVRYKDKRFFDIVYGSVHYNSHLFPTEQGEPKAKRIKITIGDRGRALPNASCEKTMDFLKDPFIYRQFHIVNILSHQLQPYFKINDAWWFEENLKEIHIKKNALITLETYLRRRMNDPDGLKKDIANLDVKIDLPSKDFKAGIKCFQRILSDEARKQLTQYGEQYLIRILLMTFGVTFCNEGISKKKLLSGSFIPFSYKGKELYEIGGVAAGFTEIIEADYLLAWFVQLCRNVVEPLFFIEGQAQLAREMAGDMLADKWKIIVFKRIKELRKASPYDIFKDVDKKIDNFVKQVDDHFIRGEKAFTIAIYKNAITKIWDVLDLPKQIEDENPVNIDDHYSEKNIFLKPIAKALDLQDTMKYVPGYREHFIHSFYVFALGYLTLKLFYQNKVMSDKKGKPIVNKSNIRRMIQTWFLTALWHDIGYSVEKTEEVMQSYLSNIIGAPKVDLPLRPSWGHLLLIKDFKKVLLLESNVIDYLKNQHCNKNELEMGKLIEKILFALIDKADHGIVSALILHDVMNHEAVKKNKQMAKILPHVLSAMMLHNSHKTIWCDKDQEGNSRMNLLPIECNRDLLSILLMYYDTVQQWGRKLNVKDPTVDLNDIVIEDNKRITIKLEYPDDGMSKVIEYCKAHYEPIKTRIKLLPNGPLVTSFFIKEAKKKRELTGKELLI